jgi:hypothetical protein
MEWIDILKEEPPSNKDLFLTDGKDIIVAHYSKVRQFYACEYEIDFLPKHWMPLPNPPKGV